MEFKQFKLRLTELHCNMRLLPYESRAIEAELTLPVSISDDEEVDKEELLKYVLNSLYDALKTSAFSNLKQAKMSSIKKENLNYEI